MLEAADGDGLHAAASACVRVELPLALPLIVAGLRLASVSTIGLVTISGDPRRPLRRARLLHLRGLPAQLPDRDPASARSRRSLLAIVADLAARRRPAAAHAVARGRAPTAGCPASTRPARCAARRGAPDGHRRRGRRLAHRPGALDRPGRDPDPAVRSTSRSRRRARHRDADRAADRPLDRAHAARRASLAVNLANLGRALPSLAVIGLVLPHHRSRIDPQLGFKVYPTLDRDDRSSPIPPILVNTYAGIAGVDRDLVEAAPGDGHARAPGAARRRAAARRRRSSSAGIRLGGRAGRRDGDARRDLRLRRPRAATSSRASPSATTAMTFGGVVLVAGAGARRPRAASRCSQRPDHLARAARERDRAGRGGPAA